MSDIFDQISNFMRGIFHDDDVFADTAMDEDLQSAWEELDAFLNTGSSAADGTSGSSRGGSSASGHSGRQHSTSGSGRTGNHGHGAQQQDLHSGMLELRKAYQDLEVPFLAEPSEVRRSYKRLVRAYHPDRWASSQEQMQTATRITSRITQAYKQIQEFEKRRGHSTEQE